MKDARKPSSRGIPGIAWAGWRALRGRPGHAFRLLRWWVWLLLFMGVLILGQAAAMTGPAAALMRLFQIAAGALPPWKEFPAGHWYHSQLGWHRYYQLEKNIRPFRGTQDDAIPKIKSTLRSAVYKRLLADVPVGVSLSGGLDSSIVTALAREETEHLHSFAVGVEGSPDIEAAKQMSRYLDTVHHEYVYDTQDMVEALPNVLYHLESFDPALVRSAIPNYFLAKLASEHVKVILTGEGADEVYAGYDYLARYETPDELQGEMLHITNALHNTNLQRADRMSMAASLEGRSPFLDHELMAWAARLPERYKVRGRRGKYLLRKTFRDQLPASVLQHRKQGFGIPVAAWLRGPLREWSHGIIFGQLGADEIIEGVFELGIFLKQPQKIGWGKAVRLVAV